MTLQRVSGPLLLVVGIVLLIAGISASHALGEQIIRAFTGRPVDTTVWIVMGGISLIIIGFGLSLGAYWHGGHGRLA